MGQSSEVRPWLANFIKGNIAVPIYGGEDASVAGRGELLHLGNDGLVILMVEWSILLDHACIRYALGLQIGFQYFVSGSGEDIVRTQR